MMKRPNTGATLPSPSYAPHLIPSSVYMQVRADACSCMVASLAPKENTPLLFSPDEHELF